MNGAVIMTKGRKFCLQRAINPSLVPTIAGAPSVVMEISLTSGSLVLLAKAMTAWNMPPPRVCP